MKSSARSNALARQLAPNDRTAISTPAARKAALAAQANLKPPAKPDRINYAPKGYPKAGPLYTEGENNDQGGNPASGRSGSPKTPYISLPGAVLNGKMKMNGTGRGYFGGQRQLGSGRAV